MITKRRSRNILVCFLIAALVLVLMNINFFHPSKPCNCPATNTVAQQDILPHHSEDGSTVICPTQTEVQEAKEPVVQVRKSDDIVKSTEEKVEKKNEIPKKTPSQKLEEVSEHVKKTKKKKEPIRVEDVDRKKSKKTRSPSKKDSKLFKKKKVSEIEGIKPRNIEDQYFADDNIPDYLSYGQYTKPRIYEPELRDRVDPRIKRNCKFCQYPMYERNYHHHGNLYSFVDAFIGDHGKYIYLITNKPDRGGSSPSKPLLEIYPTDKLVNRTSGKEIDVPIKIMSEHNLRTKHTYIFKFPLAGREYLLDFCFFVMLRQQGGEEVLQKRIFVRHCYLPETEKKPKRMAVCTMLENRDRFLVEWIEYNRMMGADHLYLYFHPGGFRYYDNAYSLLEDYMKKGIVDLFVWNYTIGLPEHLPWSSRSPNHDRDQTAAQQDCLSRYRDMYDYMAFVDDDEFLVPLEKDNMLEVLDHKRQSVGKGFGGIQLNSYVLGPGRSNDSKLSTVAYFRIDWKNWAYRKSVVYTENVDMFNVHEIARGGTNYRLDETGEYGGFIAHYYTRKWHDYNEVWEKSEKDLEGEEYTHVQRFVPELEKRVKEYDERNKVEQYNFVYHEKLDIKKDKPKWKHD